MIRIDIRLPGLQASRPPSAEAVSAVVGGAARSLAARYPGPELWTITAKRPRGRYDVKDAMGRRKSNVPAIGPGSLYLKVGQVVMLEYYDRKREKAFIRCGMGMVPAALPPVVFEPRLWLQPEGDSRRSNLGTVNSPINFGATAELFPTVEPPPDQGLFAYIYSPGTNWSVPFDAVPLGVVMTEEMGLITLIKWNIGTLALQIRPGESNAGLIYGWVSGGPDLFRQCYLYPPDHRVVFAGAIAAPLQEIWALRGWPSEILFSGSVVDESAVADEGTVVGVGIDGDSMIYLHVGDWKNSTTSPYPENGIYPTLYRVEAVVIRSLKPGWDADPTPGEDWPLVARVELGSLFPGEPGYAQFTTTFTSGGSFLPMWIDWRTVVNDAFPIVVSEGGAWSLLATTAREESLTREQVLPYKTRLLDLFVSRSGSVEADILEELSTPTAPLVLRSLLDSQIASQAAAWESSTTQTRYRYETSSGVVVGQTDPPGGYTSKTAVGTYQQTAEHCGLLLGQRPRYGPSSINGVPVVDTGGQPVLLYDPLRSTNQSWTGKFHRLPLPGPNAAGRDFRRCRWPNTASNYNTEQALSLGPSRWVQAADDWKYQAVLYPVPVVWGLDGDVAAQRLEYPNLDPILSASVSEDDPSKRLMVYPRFDPEVEADYNYSLTVRNDKHAIGRVTTIWQTRIVARPPGRGGAAVSVPIGRQFSGVPLGSAYPGVVISEPLDLPENVWQIIPGKDVILVLGDDRPAFDASPRPVLQGRRPHTLELLWTYSGLVPTDVLPGAVGSWLAGDLAWRVHGPADSGPRMKAAEFGPNSSHPGKTLLLAAAECVQKVASGDAPTRLEFRVLDVSASGCNEVRSVTENSTLATNPNWSWELPGPAALTTAAVDVSGIYWVRQGGLIARFPE